MIRLICFRRIGGRATETPRCAAFRTMAAVLAATFAVLAIGGVSAVVPIGAAYAQTAGTAGPVSLGELFDTDRVDLKPGAADKLTDAAAQVLDPRGGCPRQAKFKVRVKQGDPLFQGALAAERRVALEAFLQNQLPSFQFEVKDELGSKDDVQVDYDRMQDQEKPKLHTNSVPPKGSKVKPGDQIKVTMVARDDATVWQTGIQRIQLIAQNPGGDALVGAQDYPPVIRANCEGRPEPRTLVLTYTVPSNPPPIVRLRAIAEDFVNHHDTDIGEFPTGDWYGRFEWTHVCQGPPGFGIRTRGVGDVTLDYDGKGNLTGALAGTTPENLPTSPTCSAKFLAPATFSAKLVGSYTPGQNTFSAQATNVQTTPGRNLHTCPAGSHASDAPIFTVYEGPMFRESFRDLRRDPDGNLKSNGERTASVGPSTCTTKYSLTLRQARN